MMCIIGFRRELDGVLLEGQSEEDATRDPALRLRPISGARPGTRDVNLRLHFMSA